ncbi:MAG TPA: carboxypeptidase regulatory-like domain-containing protein [Bryobacteraceae bacterium]|nr:carboxypeptidase regulatory-like domain-containing protein [Bryobacteraceae bacterium]
MKFAFLLLLTAGAVEAQVASASLAGTVMDESAAVVAGASVVATEDSTGFSRTTVTDARGDYALEELAPGTYTLTVQKPGFRSYRAEHLILEVNQKARQQVRLAVGASEEHVAVTAQVSAVQSDSASIGYEMDQARIEDLPLASRNVVSLVTLGPGAIPRQMGGFVHDVVNDVQEGTRGSVALNAPINGARSSMNAFLLDGAYDTDRNTFAIAVYPPMESVMEFHNQTSLAPAEFAQAGGGAIDVVTKSGTSAWHGSGFEYLQNEAPDALDYFADPTKPRAILRQNQYGGSLGGPTGLKNTYFFGAYEGLRSKEGTSTQSIVPTAAQRGGDFTGSNVIYDPLDLDATGTRIPFAGNMIPSSRINSIASTYLGRFEPLPNSNSSSGNYLDSTPNQNTTDSATGRIDHQFGNQSQLTGRYTVNRENNVVAGSFPELPTSEQVLAQQIALAYTVSGARWLNDARVSFTRLRMYSVPESAFHDNIAQQLGIQGQPTDPFYYGLPFFEVLNESLVTDSPTLPQVQRDNTWHITDGISLARGRHTLKFGGDAVHFQLNYLQTNLARGQYNFTGAFSSVDGLAGNTGDPFADFLLGYPQDTKRTSGSGQAYLRQTSYAGYVQDDWRISPTLTLNLGLRYEYTAPYTEANGNLLNLDYAHLPAPPTLVHVNTAVEPDYRNFAPRIGIAEKLPFGIVFRGGYGIYYATPLAIGTYDLVLNNLLNQINETQGGQAPVLTIANGFPQTASTGFPSYFGMDPNARTPYVQQWNGGFQRELPGHVLLEVAYVGSKGTKLPRFRQFNTPAQVETGADLPPRPGDLQSLRTFPSLGEIIQRQDIANSVYHSLQFKVQKQASTKLSLLASFVWSKSIDDADTEIPGQFDSYGAQDERNLRLERGLSFFNVGRRISAGYVYRLPSTSLLGPVARNWSFSGIITLQDGTPLNPVYFATDFANSGTPNRPNIVPGQKIALPRDQRTADHFFNTAAFSDPAPFTFGDAGRDIIIGPGNNNFDLALLRRLAVREHQSVEFRVEAFNAFNHPNWGIPGPYPDFGPFFGKILSTGQPRQMQFALRYQF